MQIGKVGVVKVVKKRKRNGQNGVGASTIYSLFVYMRVKKSCASGFETTRLPTRG